MFALGEGIEQHISSIELLTQPLSYHCKQQLMRTVLGVTKQAAAALLHWCVGTFRGILHVRHGV